MLKTSRIKFHIFTTLNTSYNSNGVLLQISLAIEFQISCTSQQLRSFILASRNLQLIFQFLQLWCFIYLNQVALHLIQAKSHHMQFLHNLICILLHDHHGLKEISCYFYVGSMAREFNELALDGHNYPTWALDVKISLASRGILAALTPPEERSTFGRNIQVQCLIHYKAPHQL